MVFEACLGAMEPWWERRVDRRERRRSPRARRAGPGAGREAHSHAEAALDELSAGAVGRLPRDVLAGLAEGLRAADLV
jgi:hypothetical protein